jgi:hypothetical protein
MRCSICKNCEKTLLLKYINNLVTKLYQFVQKILQFYLFSSLLTLLFNLLIQKIIIPVVT